MGERGSTGASSSSTTRPSASCSSRSATVQFARASTSTPATIAIVLRMARLLCFGPPALQHEPRREQREPGRREQPRLEEQGRLHRVVVVGQIAEQRKDAEAREHAVAVRISHDEDRGRRPNPGRLERGEAENERGGEADAALARAELESLAPYERDDRAGEHEQARRIA